MPELPEVETVRRGLEPVMTGARIERAVAARPDLRFPLPENFAERLGGRRIEGLGRRAKYLLADLEGGTVLAMHLGMSGSFRIESRTGTSLPGVFAHARSTERLHDHVRFDLVDPHGVPVSVIFNDPRRFGYMSLIERADFGAHPHFRSLGIEPTGNALSGDALAPLFAGRAAPLKAALLDQKLIAGLGNIYVCEALWRSKLSPRRATGTLVTAKGLATKRLDDLALHIREQDYSSSARYNRCRVNPLL